MDVELQKVRLEADVELAKLEATSPAKEVAGKAIGKFGLAAIVSIVVIGVMASLWLEEGKQNIRAVTKRLGFRVVMKPVIEEGIKGLRVWRTR